MASTINAKTTGVGGIDASGDASGVLALQTGGTTAVTIDASQNVTTSTNLAVTGSISSKVGTSDGLVYLGSNNSAILQATSAELRFWTRDTRPLTFLVNDIERMRIDSSGNVGIGTSSPVAKLDITGATAGDGGTNNGTGSLVYIKQNTAWSAAQPWALYVTGYSYLSGFRINGADGQRALYLASGTLGIATGDDTSPITFSNGSGGVTERMRIDSSGNLFIGTTTNPVSNAAAIINAVVSSGDGFNLKHTVNGNNMFNLWQTGTTTYTAIGFSKGDSQTVRGTISVSTSAVAYNTTSDYRLKENIVPMVGALETVTKLKPVTYKWKENDSDGQGFIAHELQEVIPDAVTGEKDAVDDDGKPKYQGIDTSFLVATLTAAIQEQQTLIEALTARLTALEAK